MASPWSLHLVVAADKANHLGSAMCFRLKNDKAERLGHNQPEHKGFFKVGISGTKPPP